MYYEIHGNGPPLLVLHGFTASGQFVRQILHEYEPHFQLIIPDFRGHGRTNNPLNGFTSKQAADDIIKLLDYLEIKKLCAMGVSSGGDILLHIATRQADRIKAMVLDSTGHYFPKQARVAVSEWSPSKQAMEMYQQIHVHGEEQIMKIIQQMRDLEHIVDDVNFTPPYLGTIKARTLIVGGDRDEYYPVEIFVEMHKSIPDSELLIFPNTGHAVIGSKYAGELKKNALDFLLNEGDTA